MAEILLVLLLAVIAVALVVPPLYDLVRVVPFAWREMIEDIKRRLRPPSARP